MLTNGDYQILFVCTFKRGMRYKEAVLLLWLSYSRNGSLINGFYSKACVCVVNHILILLHFLWLLDPTRLIVLLLSASRHPLLLIFMQTAAPLHKFIVRFSSAL